MNSHVNAISNRLSLRPPQRESLEILARLCEIVPLEKGTDAAKALRVIKSEFPTVAAFDRDFVSLCFALAPGVSKTRLMGAFIAYLARAVGIRHFFLLAPSLTAYSTLITDFTPNTPKYAFEGLTEFASNPPEIITSDNYASGRGVRNYAVKLSDFLGMDPTVHINIFNISKINSEGRDDKPPTIKRLHEWLGESYFEYLSKLDDLVLLMDQSHRYRTAAAVETLNELRPILGLELTTTPRLRNGSRTTPFANVIYNYPLSSALRDGIVKEPVVFTGESSDPVNRTKEGLILLNLEYAICIHEGTKTQLELYARENDLPRVKPIMLVVAENTVHASVLKAIIEDDSFFHGQYRGRVIEVHSQQKGVEKHENAKLLLDVERIDNPIEIVIHVNMLKEGWDVTNLYTIVLLGATKSRTLFEQSMSLGLGLPYGKRTGIPAIDRLTIVSHHNFRNFINQATSLPTYSISTNHE